MKIETLPATPDRAQTTPSPEAFPSLHLPDWSEQKPASSPEEFAAYQQELLSTLKHYVAELKTQDVPWTYVREEMPRKDVFQFLLDLDPAYITELAKATASLPEPHKSEAKRLVREVVYVENQKTKLRQTLNEISAAFQGLYDQGEGLLSPGELEAAGADAGSTLEAAYTTLASYDNWGSWLEDEWTKGHAGLESTTTAAVAELLRREYKPEKVVPGLLEIIRSGQTKEQGAQSIQELWTSEKKRVNARETTLISDYFAQLSPEEVAVEASELATKNPTLMESFVARVNRSILRQYEEETDSSEEEHRVRLDGSQRLVMYRLLTDQVPDYFHAAPDIFMRESKELKEKLTRLTLLSFDGDVATLEALDYSPEQIHTLLRRDMERNGTSWDWSEEATRSVCEQYGLGERARIELARERILNKTEELLGIGGLNVVFERVLDTYGLQIDPHLVEIIRTDAELRASLRQLAWGQVQELILDPSYKGRSFREDIGLEREGLNLIDYERAGRPLQPSLEDIYPNFGPRKFDRYTRLYRTLQDTVPLAVLDTLTNIQDEPALRDTVLELLSNTPETERRASQRAVLEESDLAAEDQANWQAIRSDEFSLEHLPTPEQAINDNFQEHLGENLADPARYLKKFAPYPVSFENLEAFARQADSTPEQTALATRTLLDSEAFGELDETQKRALVETLAGTDFDTAVLEATETLLASSKDYRPLMPTLLASKNLAQYVGLLQHESATEAKTKAVTDILASVNTDGSAWDTLDLAGRGRVLVTLLSGGEAGEVTTLDLSAHLATHQEKIEDSLLGLIKDIRSQDTVLENLGSLEELWYEGTTNLAESLPKIGLFTRLYHSYNPEIKRLAHELVEELIKEDNPEIALEKLVSVFETKSLPLVAKRFLMFKYLYPPATLQNLRIDSAVLDTYREKGQFNRLYHTLQNDMVKVSLRSGEPELMNFLKTLRDYEEVLAGAERMEEIPDEALDQLLFQIMSFSLHSLNGKRRDAQSGLDLSEFGQLPRDEKLETLQHLFVSQSGESLLTSIQKAYLRPLGIESVQEALDIHEQVKTKRSERSRAEHADAAQMFTGQGYVKLVEAKNIEKILDFGVVSREFIGVSAGSDVTPLDTDTLRQSLELGDVQDSFRTLSQYGDLAIIVKDSSLFQQVDAADYTPVKGYAAWQDHYEVCYSGTVTEAHYGVRSGFASTDIDALVLTKKIEESGLEEIKYYLARKGLYLPIYDQTGQLVYSPEEYDKFNGIFAGTQFNPREYPKVPEPHALLSLEHQQVLTQIQTDTSQEKVRRTKQLVENQLVDILQAEGIDLHREYDERIFGAIVSDTGSTGRGTNKAAGMDFDYVVQLDAEVFDTQKETLNQAYREHFASLNPEEVNGYVKGDVVMIRFFGVEIEGEKVDVDISIGPKGSAFSEPASHEAVIQKFTAIEEQHGPEALQEVKEQIILAKTVLGHARAYKKEEHGGIGGIGVENWILNNGGSFAQACRTFAEAAHTEAGEIKPLEEFKKDYKLYTYNTGTNLRFAAGKFARKHDNYLESLQSAAYAKILELIEAHYPQMS